MADSEEAAEGARVRGRGRGAILSSVLLYIPGLTTGKQPIRRTEVFLVP